MAKHENVTHLSEVPVEKINTPGGSGFGGSRQRVGAHIGASKLGYSFFDVPPGQAAFPFHAHSGNEEMIYVIAGEGILRLGKEEIDVMAGSVIAFPTGAENAHQLINTGTGGLRYLVVSTMVYPDLCEYPDSNKIGAYGAPAVGAHTGFRALYVRDHNVNYYQGEDGKEIERIVQSRRR